MAKSSPQITRLLAAAAEGDEPAAAQLWPFIYKELRGIARQQMAGEAKGRTLQPTELVHEAWFRLFGERDAKWTNRGHFFTAAAKAMRQIRIDDARKRKRLKRGGGRDRERVVEEPVIFDQDPAEVLAVHEMLDRMEEEDPRKARIVMLRYFSGLTEEETAAALGLSKRTVQTDWRLARAWLYRELSKGDTIRENPKP